MATAKFDTLAAANELQAAGIAEAHAEAIVSTVGRAMTGLLTESRFEAAMDEMRAEFRGANSRFEATVSEANTRLEATINELRGDMKQGLAQQTAALQVLRHEMEAGLAKQLATMARYNAEIYRYLWVQGGSIIVILTSLYMLAESLARA